MNIMEIMAIGRVLLAFAGGALIGSSFGLMQRAALRRNERLQNEGLLNQGWKGMFSPPRRVAFLVVCLALIQIFCPALFEHGAHWWVSGGVVVGYGAVLFAQLRRKMRSI